MKFVTFGVSMNCLFQVIFESIGLESSREDGVYFRILATLARRSLAAGSVRLTLPAFLGQSIEATEEF